MGARILFRDAQGRSGEVVLSPDTTVFVGRALDCAVRTDDAMVSRKHSLVKMEDGRFLVEDLGSSNGTHVNDVKVSRQALNHNDVVRCGNLWLRFIEDPVPEEGAPEASAPVAAPSESAPVPSKWKATLSPVAGTDDTFDAGHPGSPPIPAPGPLKPIPDFARGGGAAAVMPDDATPAAEEVYGSPAAALAGAPPPSAGARAATSETPATAAPVGAARPAIVPPAPDGPTPPADAAPGIPPVVANTFKSQGPPSWEAGPTPAGDTSDPVELRRRLLIATSRAAELQRGLRTLQAELQAAQQKVEALLQAVCELTELKP